MSATSSRPVVFIGSSKEALPIAERVRDLIRYSAQVRLWDSSFSPGEWTLQAILDHAQDSDFGVFLMAPDDNTVLRGKRQWTVRDNVLFEAGIFMGAIGPKRTFLLWPSNAFGHLRLPSDLAGMTTLSYRYGKPIQAAQLSRMLIAIKTMGRALRSGYNEMAALRQLLAEREEFLSDGSSESFLEIITPIAARRSRPWFEKTPVRILMDGISQSYDDEIVDDIFWWLIVDGVVTFDNIDVWSSDDEWHWDDSVDYAIFTNRGTALMNQLMAEKTQRNQVRSRR